MAVMAGWVSAVMVCLLPRGGHTFSTRTTVRWPSTSRTAYRTFIFLPGDQPLSVMASRVKRSSSFVSSSTSRPRPGLGWYSRTVPVRHTRGGSATADDVAGAAAVVSVPRAAAAPAMVEVGVVDAGRK